MVRFSSLMKGLTGKKGESEEKKPAPSPASSKETTEPTPQPTLPPEVPVAQGKVSLPAQVAAEKQIFETDAWNTYEGLVDFMREAVDRLRRGEKVTYLEIAQRVKAIIAVLIRDKEAFTSLISAETPDNYIVGHQINVTILSLQMGMNLAYSNDRLLELGCSALLFDVGMMKVLDLVKQERKLGGSEFDEVKKHPEYGATVLKQLTDMPQAVIDVTLQHHERPDGKGYPRGLRGREISEYSKIVSLADVYVALTHTRPERRRLTPHDAIKELLQNARFFSPNALRALLGVISVYPIGTWVELNSHDIGRVTKLNPGQALRPIVELVCDHHGVPLEKKSVVDLIESPQLYITNVVDNETVEKWGLNAMAS